MAASPDEEDGPQTEIEKTLAPVVSKRSKELLALTQHQLRLIEEVTCNAAPLE
jgi:hypothetical protein